jgi:hypothetical protein
VVTRLAVGAPVAALALAVAPIAPEPLVPVVSTPLKLRTEIEETMLFDRVAVTVTLLNFEGAKARQISEVPFCTLVLTTSTQVRPPPETPVTVVVDPPLESVSMKANSSSFTDVVENAGVVIVEPAVVLSFDTLASMRGAGTAAPVKFTPVTFAPFTATV